jgi:hypothetical protein
MLHMSKLRIALTALCIVATIGSAFACAVTSGVFLVYQSNTGAWNINMGVSYFEEPKSYNVTVESKDSTGTFSVVYFLTVNGPKGLRNDDLSLHWVDTDGATFIIGKGGSQTFSGTGTLSWNSAQTVFKAGHKNNITLTLTFHPTAAVGGYKMNMWVLFTPTLSATISPSSATLYVGQCRLFTSSVTGGTSPYKYQWYLNGTAVSGATKPTWTFAPTSAGSYTVYVKVTDSDGMQATSNTATVTVNSRFSVCISPSSVDMHVGKSQLFSSSIAGGASPYTYQWYLNGSPVSGATKSTWTFTPKSLGRYAIYVKVTNSAKTQATSNTAYAFVEAK